ncbi:MAG: GNAT family N-acetyltransferase [Nitrosopumilaceae archaeon]
MKLDEIVKVTSQPFPNVKLDLTNAELIGHTETVPIYHIKIIGDTSYDVYALKKDNKFVTFIMGKWNVLEGSHALYIERTVTLPRYRNKGLITALYKGLYVELKYKLVSDNEMSPESISVWKKLSKVLPVKVFNTETKKTTDMKTTPDDQIFGMEQEYENIRLVLEKKELVYKETPLREGEKRIYGDIHIPKKSWQFQNLIYTHKENRGKYI